MQFLNKHVRGRQEVGHIDILQKFSYIEVPEEDARKVMKALSGTNYKGRMVRCNDADEEGHGKGAHKSERRGDAGRGARGNKSERKSRAKVSLPQEDMTDWRSLINGSNNVKLKGEEPDFSEEGWARRKRK